jgi:Protein of unknown function (DUF664)
MPNRLAGERDALTQQLDFHRATLLSKLEGLDDESLRQPMTASGVSLLGLVKHLAETEHGWFVKIYARLPEADLYSTDDDPDAEFRVGPDETADALVGSTCGAVSGPGPWWPLAGSTTWSPHHGARRSTCGRSWSTWSRRPRGTTVTPTSSERRSTA